MKNIYKIGIGAAALTLIAGGNAMAGKGQWVMKGQAPKDTVKVAKDTVANVPESAVVDEVIWVACSGKETPTVPSLNRWQCRSSSSIRQR